VIGERVDPLNNSERVRKAEYGHAYEAEQAFNFHTFQAATYIRTHTLR